MLARNILPRLLSSSEYLEDGSSKIPGGVLHRKTTKQSNSTVMFVDPCIIVKFMKKNPTRWNSVSKFINPYLYKPQHVSGDTPPIIRSLILH